MTKKGWNWIISVSLVTLLIIIFLAQNKKIEIQRLRIEETNQELKDKKDEISTIKDEMDAQRDELLKLSYNFELERKAYEEKNEELTEKIKNANSLMSTNVSLMFGDRAPMVDSSIPSDITSIINELFEAMKKNDASKFAELDKKKVLTSFFKQRDKVEKILWIQNDPDNRGEAVKEWFEINSEMKLLKVLYFMKDGSIIDPNYAMVRENGKWVIFRED